MKLNGVVVSTSYQPPSRKHQRHCQHPDPDHTGGCPYFGPAASVTVPITSLPAPRPAELREAGTDMAVQPDPWAAVTMTSTVADEPIGFMQFHTATVPVLTDVQGAWVSINSLCEAMGVDTQAQQRMIARKPWSKGWTAIMAVQVPGDIQSRPHLFIHEKRVPMWLANIDTSRLRDPIVRARVESAQIEFADVLAEWVSTGRVEPRTSEAVAPVEVPRTLAQALRLAAEQAEALEAAESQVALLEPKADAYDRHLGDDKNVKSGILIERVAKDLHEDFPGIGVKALREFLKHHRIMYKRQLDCGTEVWDAYSTQVVDVYPARFVYRRQEVTHNTRGSACVHHTMLVTSAGFDYIKDRLRKAGWTAE